MLLYGYSLGWLVSLIIASKSLRWTISTIANLHENRKLSSDGPQPQHWLIPWESPSTNQTVFFSFGTTQSSNFCSCWISKKIQWLSFLPSLMLHIMLNSSLRPFGLWHKSYTWEVLPHSSPRNVRQIVGQA